MSLIMISLIITDQQIPPVQNEEEEEDVEYNVLADLHCDEDYEELRNDRAVHISRKTCHPPVTSTVFVRVYNLSEIGERV